MKKTPPQKKTNNKMPEDKPRNLPHPPASTNQGHPNGKPGNKTKFKPKIQQNLKTGKVQHG